MPDKIFIQDLSVKINHKTVIKHVNLKVSQGECLVIMGCSGSGKSVLIKTILGFNPFYKGSLMINEAHITGSVRDNCERHNIGMVFQNIALIDDFCVWENVALRFILQYKVTSDVARNRALKQLAEVGLSEENAGKFPYELSVGMARRVAIARAVFANPSVVLMDEPTAGLDPASCALVADIIRNLSDKTVVVVTHDLALCCKIADSVAFIKDGEMVEKYNKGELFSVEDPYVKSFLNKAY